ncbi:hypothetical protein C8R44DRAFT_887606 [Mycena epipterygia]|nr:hypothetical protein C8R44DRAFT_887606 [Mycena epipterygia]
MDGQKGSFPYSYFADTFMYDMAPTKSSNIDPGALTWRQVRTPGFPTYRCQAHLQCDSATGRTYMFGGWTNSQFIPTRSKLLSRSFGDLWELRMDVPGGNFGEVDVAEEVRVARAGPWQHCFACRGGTVEKIWRELRGTCLFLRDGVFARRVERTQAAS